MHFFLQKRARFRTFRLLNKNSRNLLNTNFNNLHFFYLATLTRLFYEQQLIVKSLQLLFQHYFWFFQIFEYIEALLNVQLELPIWNLVLEYFIEESCYEYLMELKVKYNFKSYLQEPHLYVDKQMIITSFLKFRIFFIRKVLNVIIQDMLPDNIDYYSTSFINFVGRKVIHIEKKYFFLRFWIFDNFFLGTSFNEIFLNEILFYLKQQLDLFIVNKINSIFCFFF